MSSHRHQEERGSGLGRARAGVSPADMVVELYVLRRATCACGRQAGGAAEGDLRQESCRIGFLTTSCKKRSPLPHPILSHPIRNAIFSPQVDDTKPFLSPTAAGSVMHILTFFSPPSLSLLSLAPPPEMGEQR